MTSRSFAACLLALFFACSGCGPASKNGEPAPAAGEDGSPRPVDIEPSPRPLAKEPIPSTPVDDRQDAKPRQVVEITAKALGDEYAKDETAAGQKYQGKVVRVTGEVESVAGEMVYIKAGSKKILLRFPTEADAKQHFAGQEIVVEGRVGITAVLGPYLKDFRIISKSPQQPPEDKPVGLKAAEITKAFEDDPQAAEKRFSPLKRVTVEGTVKEVLVDNEGKVSVILAGHKESGGVMCNTFKDNETVKTKVKEGQTIKVRGAWYGEVAGMYVVGYGELVE